MTDVVDHPPRRPGTLPAWTGSRSRWAGGNSADGTGHLLDHLALRQRELRWSVTGVLPSQGIEPVSVEVADDLSDPVFGGEGDLGDGGHVHGLGGPEHDLGTSPSHHCPRTRRTIPRSLFLSKLAGSRTCTRSAITKVCATWHFRWWTRPQQRWQSSPWLPHHAMLAASINSRRHPVPSSPVYRIAMVRTPSALPDSTPCPSAWRHRSSLPIGRAGCRRSLRTLATSRTRAR